MLENQEPIGFQPGRLQTPELERILNPPDSDEPAPRTIPVQAATPTHVFNYAIIFVIGLVLGWMVLGWGIWPVEWTDATVAELSTYDKANVVNMAARLYSFDGNATYPQHVFDTWENAPAFICLMADMAGDPAQQARLVALAGTVGGCAGD